VSDQSYESNLKSASQYELLRSTNLLRIILPSRSWQLVKGLDSGTESLEDVDCFLGERLTDCETWHHVSMVPSVMATGLVQRNSLRLLWYQMCSS